VSNYFEDIRKLYQGGQSSTPSITGNYFEELRNKRKPSPKYDFSATDINRQQPTTTIAQPKKLTMLTPSHTSTLTKVDDNPDVTPNFFRTRPLIIRKNDNPVVKGLKGAGNVLSDLVDTPGEALGRLSIQAGSLLSGHGLKKDSELPRDVTFTRDILLPATSKKYQNQVKQMQQNNPGLATAYEMLVGGAADPMNLVGGGSVKALTAPKILKAEAGMAKIQPLKAKDAAKLRNFTSLSPEEQLAQTKNVIADGQRTMKQTQLDTVFADLPKDAPVQAPNAPKIAPGEYFNALDPAARKSGLESVFPPVKSYKLTTEAQKAQSIRQRTLEKAEAPALAPTWKVANKEGSGYNIPIKRNGMDGGLMGTEIKKRYWGNNNENIAVDVHYVPREGARELKILKDGTVILYADPVYRQSKDVLKNTLTRDIDNYLSPLAPDEFIRVAKNADDYQHVASGTHRGSINHRDNIEEGGLSVAKYPEFPTDNMYIVKGKVVGKGTDGEPLLDLKTVKPVSKSMTHKQFLDFWNKRYDENLSKLGISKEDASALISGGKVDFSEFKLAETPAPRISLKPREITPITPRSELFPEPQRTTTMQQPPIELPAQPIKPVEATKVMAESTGLDDAIKTRISEITKTTKAESAVDALREARDAARARMAARKGRVMSGIPVDDLADMAIIGATHIAEGTIKFGSWSAKMIEEFGDDVKPHLNDLWEKAKVVHGDISVHVDSFRSKIDRTPQKGKPFGEKIAELRTQFVDDVAPLEKLEKSVTGEVASAEKSIYKQARLFRGSAERAHEKIASELQPIIKEIEGAGYSSQDLGNYALAVHAKDVNAKGMTSGFTNEEISAVINELGNPTLEKARQKLVDLSTKQLQELADNGIIEQSMVKTLRDKWPNYMPLFRSFDDDKVEFARGLSKSLANVTSPIKKLKGSERDVVDPLESMVKNIFQTTNAVDRNKVALQLGKLADSDKSGSIIRRLAEGEERGRLNAVYAMEGGKKVHYEVQPDVYKAMLNLDKESSNLLIKILSKPASLLRAGATLTPEFALRNPLRDIPNAFIVSQSGFNPLFDIPASLLDITKSKIFKKDTLYNQFLRDNGGFGNIVSLDRKVHQEVLEKIIKQPPSKMFLNIIDGKSFIGLLRKMADVSETATKLGEYRAALGKGATGAEAAYRARDLMDFSRAGTSIREANKAVAFLNANIQGKSKMIRAIKENPVGVATRAVTAVTLPTVGVFLAQKYLSNDVQKKLIDDAPTWLKDSFWLIPIPGTDQILRFPKPFDWAPLFANLPERWLNYMFDNDPKAFDDFASSTLTNFTIPVMITGIAPFVEGMANYSFFQQSPIIPKREEGQEFPTQFDNNTSEAGKLLGSGINKLTGGEGPFKNFGSPRVVDNTIRGLTGGLGSYTLAGIDKVAEGTGLVPKKNKAAKDISGQPLLRAFLVNQAGTGKSMDDLYSEKDRLTRLESTAKAKGDAFSLAPRLMLLENAVDSLSDINKEMRQINNDKSLDPLTKRTQLSDLNKQRNSIAQQTMKKSGDLTPEDNLLFKMLQQKSDKTSQDKAMNEELSTAVSEGRIKDLPAIYNKYKYPAYPPSTRQEKTKSIQESLKQKQLSPLAQSYLGMSQKEQLKFMMGLTEQERSMIKSELAKLKK